MLHEDSKDTADLADAHIVHILNCLMWELYAIQGVDPGFLESGFKVTKGVGFVNFTSFFLNILKYPHENEIIWSQKWGGEVGLRQPHVRTLWIHRSIQSAYFGGPYFSTVRLIFLNSRLI